MDPADDGFLDCCYTYGTIKASEIKYLTVMTGLKSFSWAVQKSKQASRRADAGKQKNLKPRKKAYVDVHILFHYIFT